MRGSMGRVVADAPSFPTADQTARYAALYKDRGEEIKEKWYFQPAYKYTSLETGFSRRSKIIK